MVDGNNTSFRFRDRCRTWWCDRRSSNFTAANTYTESYLGPVPSRPVLSPLCVQWSFRGVPVVGGGETAPAGV